MYCRLTDLRICCGTLVIFAKDRYLRFQIADFRLSCRYDSAGRLKLVSSNELDRKAEPYRQLNLKSAV